MNLHGKDIKIFAGSSNRPLAEEIASKAPIALRYAKEASQVTAVMPRREGYRFEQNITVALSKTEDTAEAQRAFKEKRPPVYKGR